MTAAVLVPEVRPAVDPDVEAQDANQTLALLHDERGQLIPIANQDEYAMVADLLKQANHKFKFLEEERQITVAPSTRESKRINDWFRPATTAFKSIREACEQVMGAWVMKQKQEERRLMDEAAAAAAVVLATAPSAVTAPIAAATGALVTAAAATVPAKVAGVAPKPVWKWVIKDAASLPRAFLMPDEKKIREHVAANGNKNVPSGVEVTEDVKFTVR